MQPLIDEVVLQKAPTTSDVVLTTHRVRARSESSLGAGADVVSIMLEEVASCGLVRRSKPWLLILAGIVFFLFILLPALFGGLFGGYGGSSGPSDGAITFGLLIVAVLVAVYFITRQMYLVVASAGESIKVATRSAAGGVNVDQLIAFIDAVEAAKNMRHLNRTPTPPTTTP